MNQPIKTPMNNGYGVCSEMARKHLRGGEQNHFWPYILG
jgi:hypothetical protein